MSRYVAFLRGINVGRAHRVTSADLRSCLTELGFTDAATFRTSGNLIFDAESGKADDIATRVEEGLERSVGFAVPVFLRTEAEVMAIAGHRPFPSELVEASKGKLQVAFLTTKPTTAKRKRALALATDEDGLAIRGRELYWLPRGGTLESALDQKALGAALGATTMRTKGTVEQLAAKYFAD